jgi:tetratricopeptide (TPR) repeat protein
VYHTQERFKEAADTLEIAARIFGSHDPEACAEWEWDCVKRLAEASSQDREIDYDDRGKRGFPFLEKYYQRLQSRTHQDEELIEALQGLAWWHDNFGDGGEADRLYERLFVLWGRNPEAHRDRIAARHIGLAIHISLRPDPGDAEHHFREYLRLTEAAPEPRTIDTVEALYRLANFLSERHRFDEAEVYFDRAWDTYASLPNPPGVAGWIRDRYRNFVSVSGRDDRLTPLLERLGPPPETDRFVDRLAELREAERLQEPDSPELIDLLRYVANACPDFETKHSYLSRALSIRIAHLGEKDREVFKDLVFLTRVCREASRFPEADQYLRRAEEHWRGWPEYTGRDSPYLLEHRAYLAEAQENLPLMREYHRRVEEECARLDPFKDAYWIAEHHYRMTLGYLRRQDFVEAERLIRFGIRVWEQYLTPQYDAVEFQDYYADLGRALAGQGRTEEADAARRRSAEIWPREREGIRTT